METDVGAAAAAESRPRRSPPKAGRPAAAARRSARRLWPGRAPTAAALVAAALALLGRRCAAEVRSGESIYLESHTGRRIDILDDVVRARFSQRHESQELIIEGEHDGVIRSGQVVYLRTPDGRYLDVDGERLEARWNDRGRWQRFIVESASGSSRIENGDVLFFRAHTGMYVDVEDLDVFARWPDQGEWQAFKIHDKDEEGGAYDLFHGALDVIGTGCGFVSMQQVGGWTQCNEALQTDCTSERRVAKACPRACPYAAPDPQLSCVFRCVAPQNCSKANPETAYANNLTRVCEPCGVVGCRRCSSQQVCAECFDNFVLAISGRACMYIWDDRAQHGVHAAAALFSAIALLATVVLVIADHCACCGTCLPKEEAEEAPEVETSDDDGMIYGREVPVLKESCTSKAIRQGKRHRARCKLVDLEVLAENSEAPSATSMDDAGKLPIWTNFRASFLTGVGLPLFHQWYLFLFLYSSLMTAGTFYVYRYSELGGVLQKTAIDHASSVLHGDGEDTMTSCGLRARNSDKLGDAVRAFAWRAAAVYFLLWAVGFALSVAHAVRQRRVAAEFYREHPCLAEFALNVEGFPPDATDEVMVRNFLREEFNTSDLEVSVGYDFRGHRRRVDELLEKVLVHTDVRALTYDKSLALPHVRAGRSGALSKKEQQEVKSWLMPGRANGVRNAGQVFAIFKHTEDLQRCRSRFEPELGPENTRPRRVADPVFPHEATPRWLPLDARPLNWEGPDGKKHDLLIRDVVCEPPDVVWENLGLGRLRLVSGHIAAFLAIVVSFVGMATGLFLPLAEYSINYMMEAGSLPTGIMMSVLGTLVMAANWVMCFVHSNASSFVGFDRRDREGLLLFRVFAFLCLTNFLFNVSIALFPESQAHAFEYIFHPLRSGVVTMQGVAFHARVSAHFFHVLVPGGLFIGYLMWPLQGFMWPFISTLAHLRCKYRRARVVTARSAELALESLGISLPHDYMGTIVQPTSVSLVLFFASDAVWQTFACLIGWSLFMIPFMRYLHMRQVRRFYFTTNRLDVDVLFCWGVPLSMVLAASFFWAAQFRGLSLCVVPAAWAASMALYAFVLARFIKPLIPPKSEGACLRPSYDEVRAKRRYDWHNCNPIKVLLSHCEDTIKGPIIPYAVGKEYLLNVSRKHLRTCSTTEFRSEQDGDRFQGGASSSTWRFFPTLPEVEALINGPLEAFGAWDASPQDRRTESLRSVSSVTPSAAAPVSPQPVQPVDFDSPHGEWIGSERGIASWLVESSWPHGYEPL